MKKILVVSDSHGNGNALQTLAPLVAENDYIIHLGDGAGDMKELRAQYPEKVFVCAGNCDFFSPLPPCGELEVEYLKIFYCHGHHYGVKSGLDNLVAEGKRRGADILLYGHTHQACIENREGILLINPGSLRYPVGKGGSYCYLVIHKDKATPVIVGDGIK